MCALYGITTNYEAIRALFRVTQDNYENMPSLYSFEPNLMN
jgi:hypothetical protein